MSSQAAAVSALQRALAAEHAASYGYGVIGAYLSGRGQAQAGADWVAHQRARDQLEQLLAQRGAMPVPAATAYQMPVRVHSSGSARAAAALVEDGVAAAYLGLVALTDTQLRRLGADQVTAAALRAASWRGSTVAFPGSPAGVPAG
jgi:hypothetical protein